MNELENISSGSTSGRAPGLWLTVTFAFERDRVAAEARFLSVVRQWLTTIEIDIPRERFGEAAFQTFDIEERVAHQAARLRSILPDWFIESFEGHSREDLERDDNLWDYESWVYAMENRVWRWWGHRSLGSELIVELQLDSWPCSVGPLRYAAWAAGGALVALDE